MRTERQLATAAGLAGLLPPAALASDRAARIASDIAPAIAAAIAAEIDMLRQLRAAREREEQRIFEACRGVGLAVDRLEQARFTAAEPAARRGLEQAAKTLRRAIQAKDVHATR